MIPETFGISKYDLLQLNKKSEIYSMLKNI